MNALRRFFIAITIVALQACGDSDSGSSRPLHEQYQPTAPVSVQDANYANPADVAEAEKFLSDLPPACSSSHASASADGTVNIRVLCSGNGKSMDGFFSIKNGVVTQVR